MPNVIWVIILAKIQSLLIQTKKDLFTYYQDSIEIIFLLFESKIIQVFYSHITRDILFHEIHQFYVLFFKVVPNNQTAEEIFNQLFLKFSHLRAKYIREI